MNRTIYNAKHRTLERTMSHITANELKTRGIAAIEAQLADGRTEAVVSVRGADRYVVMDLAHYQHLRECELDAALAESRADLAAGRFVAETAQQHVSRVQALIAGGGSAAAKTPARRAEGSGRAGRAGRAKNAKSAKRASGGAG